MDKDDILEKALTAFKIVPADKLKFPKRDYISSVLEIGEDNYLKPVFLSNIYNFFKNLITINNFDILINMFNYLIDKLEYFIFQLNQKRNQEIFVFKLENDWYFKTKKKSRQFNKSTGESKYLFYKKSKYKHLQKIYNIYIKLFEICFQFQILYLKIN